MSITVVLFAILFVAGIGYAIFLSADKSPGYAVGARLMVPFVIVIGLAFVLLSVVAVLGG